MAALIEARDWSTSPVGPIDGWPAALRNAVGLILPAGAEIVMFWGPEFVAFYNDAYAPTIGNKHPHALGRPACEGWAELWDDLRPLLASVRETGETFSDKDRPFYIERHGYGEEVNFDISYSAVPDDDGSVGGVLCIVSETTERVRASRRIGDENARLSKMFDQAPGFMAVIRPPDYVVEIANQSYLDLIGRRDAVGQRVADFFPEPRTREFIALLDGVVATGRPHRGAAVALDLADEAGRVSETRFVDFVYQPITDTDGNVSTVFIEGSDVTDRVRDAEKLALSEESLRLAAESAELGLWDVDIANGTMVWSERTKALFGVSPNVPVSMDDFYAGLHPDDIAHTTEAFESAIDPARRTFYDVEYRTIGAEDGVIRWVAAKGRGVFDPDGICIRAIGSVIDISAAKEAGRAMRESEQRFRTMADSAPALIWMTDATGRMVFANRWYHDEFGHDLDASVQHAWRAIVHPDDVEAFLAGLVVAFRAREPISVDARFVDRAGRTRWLHCEGRARIADGEFAGYVGCNVDVTDVRLAADALERGIAERTAELADANAELTAQIAERERVEEELHQMQRLEAIGQLTSGVAHDFNNLLTVVLGNVDMIGQTMRDLGADDRSLKRADHVRTAAERGATLTAQLLAFSRRQRLEAQATDLNATVRGMRGLLESSLGTMVSIETRLASDIWPALVDPTQIELIILNLAINARDAMEGAGQITIETANVTMGPPRRPEHPPEGDHVLVALSDTGSGMTEEVLARAFEPFFTTKDVGRGSGLGLAQVFGFAKQSGGGVHIDTRPGEGTTVRVYLPRCTAIPVQAFAPKTFEIRQVGANRRVLVVDDDAAVRSVTVDALTEIGCDVVEAESGEAALTIIGADERFELAVIDFVMPGMNGAAVARQIRERQPELKIVFVTGHADLDAIAAVPQAQIVQKPFDRAELQARVGRLLER